MDRMLCRICKGQIVLRTCRVDDGVEGYSGTGEEPEKELEENREKELEQTLE